MSSAIWQIEVDGQQHEVELQWTYWGGERNVLVDGTIVDADTQALRWKSDQSIDVGGKRCVVITRPKKVNKVAFDVLLEVDGQELTPASTSH